MKEELMAASIILNDLKKKNENFLDWFFTILEWIKLYIILMELNEE